MMVIPYVWPQELITRKFLRFIRTARKQSLRQGYVFTRVCHSAHGGACVAQGSHHTPMSEPLLYNTMRTDTNHYTQLCSSGPKPLK